MDQPTVDNRVVRRGGSVAVAVANGAADPQYRGNANFF